MWWSVLTMRLNDHLAPVPAVIDRYDINITIEIVCQSMFLTQFFCFNLLPTWNLNETLWWKKWKSCCQRKNMNFSSTRFNRLTQMSFNRDFVSMMRFGRDQFENQVFMFKLLNYICKQLDFIERELRERRKEVTYISH